MKRILAFCLALVMCLSLCACGEDTPRRKKDRDNSWLKNEQDPPLVQEQEDTPREYTPTEAAAEEPEEVTETEAPDVRFAEGVNRDEVTQKYVGVWHGEYDGAKLEFLEDGRLIYRDETEFLWRNYDGRTFDIFRGDEWVGAGYLQSDVSQDYWWNRLKMETPGATELIDNYIADDGRSEPVERPGVVALTLDNWQDYFEFRPYSNGPLYDFNGVFQRLDLTSWNLYLKENPPHPVLGLCDVEIEYTLTEGYFCWFEYNFETGVLVQKEAAAPGEVGEWRRVEDSKGDRLVWMNSVKDDDCFIAWIIADRSVTEPVLTDTTYSFIANAYGKMEITGIRGAVRIEE